MADLGIRNLGDIRAAVLKNVRRGADLHPGLEAHITELVNQAQDIAVARRDWKELEQASELGQRREGDATLPTFKSGDLYVPMPWSAARVQLIKLLEPTRLELAQVESKGELISLSSQGTGLPRRWCEWGRTAQSRPVPADDATLTLECDVDVNDSDVGGDETVIVDYLPSGYEPGEEGVVEKVQGLFSDGIALSETVPAGYPVRSVSLSTGWAGTLTITEDGGPTEIVRIRGAEIPFDEQGSQGTGPHSRILIRLDATNDVDRTAAIVWQRHPRRLYSVNDEPELPIHNFLVHQVTALLFASRFDDRTRAAEHFALAEQSLMAKAGKQSRTSAQSQPRFWMGNPLSMTGMSTRSHRRGFRTPGS